MEITNLGLGTYLGDSTDAADLALEDAVAAFLAQGGNAFDTAANYRGGRSELALGRALEGQARDSFFVSTKAGYIPLPSDADPEEEPRSWFHRTYEAPGILSVDDLVDGCHAMTPGYLSHQLDVSRRALGVDTVDVLHLHNPEVQLKNLGPEAFEAALHLAFEACERFVAEGKIRAYGMATWNAFRVQADDAEHLELEALLALAERVGGRDHHFRWLQLPLNLALPEAFVVPTQTLGGERMTLLRAAQTAGLSVQTSAPLMQARILHQLPKGLMEAFGATTPAQACLQFPRSCPGVTMALCGMGQRAHVVENAALLKVPKVDPGALASLFG